MATRAALMPALLLLSIAVASAGCIEEFFANEDEDEFAARAPAISFAVDEPQDRISVMSAASSADWHRLVIEVGQCTVSPPAAAAIVAGAGSSSAVRTNIEAGSSGAALNTPKPGPDCGPAAPKRVGTDSTTMHAADYIDLCVAQTDVGSDVRGVRLAIRDTTANAIVYVHTFEQVQACPR